MTVIEDIVRKEIGEFADQLQEKNITLEVTDACTRWLAEHGYSEEFGARNIARLVEEKIKGYFVDAVLFGELQDGGFATADVLAGEVIITPGRAHDGERDGSGDSRSPGHEDDGEAPDAGRDEAPAESE